MSASPATHSACVVVVEVNATNWPSGADEWQPTQDDDTPCACAYCDGLSTSSTDSSPGENPWSADTPVVASFVVQYTIAPVACTGATPIGVEVPSASPSNVAPERTPPRTLRVIASVG